MVELDDEGDVAGHSRLTTSNLSDQQMGATLSPQNNKVHVTRRLAESR